MSHYNKKINFIDNNGSFRIEYPENTSYLYFPLSGEKGLKSSVTPILGGDSMLDQERFLLEPVSVENLHNNKNTRNFWLYMEDGSVWSACGSSAEQESHKFTASQDKSSVSAGFMWHTAKRKNAAHNLTSEITSFVPYDENVEIMSVTITNNSSEDQSFNPIAAIPLYGRSADNLRDHRNVTSMLHRIETIDEGVLLKPTMSFDEKGHRPNNTIYFVVGHTGEGQKPVSFYPAVTEFLGEGGSFAKPRAIYRQQDGVASGVKIDGREAVGGLRFAPVTLKPSSSITYNIVLGITDDEKNITEINKKYQTKAQVDAELKNTKEYWLEKVNVHFHTGSSDFDKLMKWTAFQPFLRRLYGCSFLPYHDYGRGGRGWRDLWQDCLSLLFMEPKNVRDMIVANFGGVRVDGTNATIIGEGLGSFKADRNGIARVWMDHAYWPFRTLLLYIEQSGDFNILSEKVPYFKDTLVMRGNGRDDSFESTEENIQKSSDGNTYLGSIIEHLLIENLCAYYEVGEHGNLRLRGADWNDALDMAPNRGESVAFTHAYAGNLADIASLLLRYEKSSCVHEIEILEELRQLIDADTTEVSTIEAKLACLDKYCSSVDSKVSGKTTVISISELAGKLTEMADSLRSHLTENEWVKGEADEGWFNSYYDDNSRPSDRYAEDDEAVRMMLTGQVFAIMDGTADKDKIQKIINAADHYLYRSEIGGYRLNTDFKELKLDMGRMFGFAYGEKENGAVFSHMTVMFANALYKRGFAKSGYKAIKTLADTALNFDVSHMYPGIPEYFNADGRGVYPYLTGAASWYLLTMITEVFGVHGNGGDLEIAPKLVAEQFDSEGKAGINLNFAGKNFDITIINESGKEYGEYAVTEVKLNGSAMTVSDDKAMIDRSVIEGLNNTGNIIIVKVR